MHFLIVIILIIGYLPYSATAEIYNCNGVWKNQPCQDQVIKTLPSVERQKERPTKTPEHMTKKFIVHKFITYAYEQKNKHNLDYPVRFVENYCLADDTTFEACQKEIAKHTKNIKDELEKNTKLTDENNKTNVNNNSTKVVVIQNNLFGIPSASPVTSLMINQDRRLIVNQDKRSREGPFVGYRSK